MGSTNAINIDAKGNIWVFERCGANSCAQSTLDPILQFDQSGKLIRSFGAGRFVFPHGIEFDKDGNLLGKGDIKAQTRRIFEQIKMIVEAGGGKMDDVVKVTVFVTDVRYREPYGEVRSEFFGPNPPASTLVQISNLAIPDALIEIEAVAALDG